MVCIRPYWQQKSTLVKCALLGGIPFIAWMIFATYYYGFPFPNTAYAKLGNKPFGGEWSLMRQGFLYLKTSLISDPITLCSIGIGLILGAKGVAPLKALACGIALYLLYIISIGGDFMSGRFLTAPLILAIIVIAQTSLTEPLKNILLALFGALISVGLYLNYATFLGQQYQSKVIDGIADERTVYPNVLQDMRQRLHNTTWDIGPRSVLIIDCGGLGLVAISLNPGTHVTDACALADPLLARLPINPLGDWRIGHFVRKIPLGYEETLSSQKNNISNKDLKHYYATLSKIVHGELNSWDRVKSIAIINLGLTLSRPSLANLYDNAMTIPHLNQRIQIGQDEGSSYLPPPEFGWSYANIQGAWTNSFRSMLLLPLPTESPKFLDLNVGSWIHPKHPKQDVKIFLNGELINQISLIKLTNNQIIVPIPNSALKKKFMVLEFEFNNAKRPNELDAGRDGRIMGMVWESFEYH